MQGAKAIAIANNDYVHIAWSYDEKLDDCAGFSIHRFTKDTPDAGVALPMFERGPDGARLKVCSDQDPIRKYSWRDVSAPRDGTYKYRVIPMKGPNVPLAGVPQPETDWVTVSEQCGDHATVFFNRGILATQATADDLFAARTKSQFTAAAETLKTLIETRGSHLRKSLSGELFKALTTLLDRARNEGGSCWAALFELTDQELIERLCACKDLHLILANNNDEVTLDGHKKTVYDGKNKPAAEALQKAIDAGGNIEVIRRYMPSGHIGHNKFMVYCDKAGTPKAVLTGSTNWTASGLCTQSNNAIMIESEELAGQYLAYWQDLRKDVPAHVPVPPASMKGIQGQALRKSCASRRPRVSLDGMATIQAWFSPNTSPAKRAGKGDKASLLPVDMAEVYEILHGARQSILFLAFMPGKAGAAGSFHFLKEVARVISAKPELFVRGAVSDPALTNELDRTRWSTEFNDDMMVVSPQCIWKDFEDWREEIYKYGHAVIHDKTIVVDPFSPNCVVITGSHNLGFRASMCNDENVLIIRGDRAVAQAYAAHVMDIVEHYRARWIAAKDADSKARKEAGGKKVSKKDALKHWTPPFSKDGVWQNRYFDATKP
ncbi:MAG TPA: phospholipase D-like domain-containing protein, partial [Thermoanaerobaculia bacterium]|nr:phospholipase D-like domain-containing protein [Thermoanaerobaculia bacterium]